MKEIIFGVRSYLQDREKRTLIDNFFSLSLLQIVNYLLPLITFPYLVRVLGVEKFGLLAFATAFVMYFQLLVDYGFSFSAVRSISLLRNNKRRLSQTFSTVIAIKCGFALIGLFLVIAVLAIFPKLQQDWLIYILSYGVVIGSALFPSWFFLGIEKARYVASAIVLTRLLFTLAIFLFINATSDYLYVPLINSFGSIIAGLIGIFFVVRNFRLPLRLPTIAGIIDQLKHGWDTFITSVAVSFYTISNTFILGLFTNNLIVGYYSVGEKVVNIAASMMTVFSQTVFPYICYLWQGSKSKAFRFFSYITIVVAVVALCISAGLLIFARPITKLILGPQFEDSIAVVQILSFTPFLGGLVMIYATFFFLALGYDAILRRIMLASTIVSVAGAIFFVKIVRLEHIGVSINMLFTQVFVLTLLIGTYMNISRKVKSNHFRMDQR